MKHFERVKAFPRPVFDSGRLRVLLEMLDGLIGGGRQQFVVVFVGSREPRSRALRENTLKKRSAAPLIKFGVVAQ